MKRILGEFGRYCLSSEFPDDAGITSDYCSIYHMDEVSPYVGNLSIR